ncbi:synaptotagmin-10-like [Tubulanus polymorphus]|uniref:synaptotagmin-10-like n=1 Tax=Tubulanus polymorphus TaxID=672921 RepID=UPI003DA401C0
MMLTTVSLGIVCGLVGGILAVVCLLACRYVISRQKDRNPSNSDVSEDGTGQFLPAHTYVYLGSSGQELQISKEHLPVQPRTTPSPIPTIQRERMKVPESPVDDNISIGACSNSSLNSSGFDVPLGTIQPDLYQKKDAVLRQESGDSVKRLGRLHVRLKYEFKTSDLVVHLIEAQDLPSVDLTTGFSDPYVKIALQPQVDSKPRQSSVKRKTCHPVFDEYFKFPITYEEVKERQLVFHVNNFDRFSRHEGIGQVTLDLKSVDISTSIEVWSDIQQYQQTESPLGELLVSLSYLPSAERLTVVIMKAQNLRVTSESGSSDPYVRVSLIVDGKRVKKKKTAVRKGTTNPVWNEALVFNIPAEMLQKVALEITVLDYDLLGHNDAVGHCNVARDVEGIGEKHWLDMISNHRKAIAMWHPLRYT